MNMNTLLKLPANKAANRITSAGRQANPPHRILVVDDETNIRQLSTSTLIRSGYQVDAVKDGAAAWEALHTHNYALMITDHSMPKVTGVELVKKMRSAGMTLPVILVSGALPTEELDRNPQLQLAATVRKPFGSDELLNTVKKVLSASTVPATANRVPVTVANPAIFE